jgi:hypothetical protein
MKAGEHSSGTGEQEHTSNMVSRAYQQLESHPSFHHHCQTVRIMCIEGRLVLTGQLPSFYLKQLLQEALRGLEAPIDNQIDVVCSDGVSSTRVRETPFNPRILVAPRPRRETSRDDREASR